MCLREADSGKLEAEVLRLVDRTNLTALVVAAVSTDLMGRLGLTALRTRADRYGTQRVVGAALRRPRFRMPAFGIGHDSVLLLSIQ